MTARKGHSPSWSLAVMAIAFSVFALITSQQIDQPKEIQTGDLGLRVFPLGLSILIGLGGLLELARCVQAAWASGASKSERASEEGTRHVIVSLAGIATYVLLISKTGFILTSLLFATLALVYLGTRWGWAVLTAGVFGRHYLRPVRQCLSSPTASRHDLLAKAAESGDGTRTLARATVANRMDVLWTVLAPSVLLPWLLGMVFGVFVGATPGLTATMAVALILPISYKIGSTAGLAMIIGVSFTAIFAGDIPATYLRIPGTPASAAAILDGHEMHRKGKGKLALMMDLFLLVLRRDDRSRTPVLRGAPIGPSCT